jgi:hypothetical protein
MEPKQTPKELLDRAALNTALLEWRNKLLARREFSVLEALAMRGRHADAIAGGEEVGGIRQAAKLPSYSMQFVGSRFETSPIAGGEEVGGTLAGGEEVGVSTSAPMSALTCRSW